MNTLGPVLRRIREEQGLTQTELAEKTGIARAHLSQIEAGKIGTPNADTRRRLAEALGVSHLELLVAAGEITEDELIAVGVEGRVERPADDLRAQLHAAVDAVPNWEAAKNIARTVLWTMQAVRYDQTPHAEGEATAAPPFANSGQGR